MKRLAIIAVVFGVLLGAPALAQQPPGPPPPGSPGDGPPPEVRERIEQARTDARTQAMTALTADHQAKVNAVIARVKAAQLTDPHDAAQQLDAILTPTEARSVVAAREKLMTAMRDAFAGPDGPHDGPAPGAGPGPGGGFAPGGGPGAGFAPGGGPGPGGFGPGGPGGTSGDGPPPDGRRRLAGHPMRDDAGLSLLMLNLSRDQMHTLFENARPPQ